MKWIPVLIIIAAVSLIVGMVFRAVGEYAALDLTPSAFMRFTDTLLFFAIALGIYFLARRKHAE